MWLIFSSFYFFVLDQLRISDMSEAMTRMTRSCPECEIDCQCGCQSNIYLLPLEVLERILWYEDPMTLIALEGTSKHFWFVVSNFWNLYCKRKGLTKKPTPLCSYWCAGDGAFHSYNRAVERVNDDRLRWRIMAIRIYLRHNCKCVICRSPCDKVEHFVFGEDVLLCIRCMPRFSITVTHDLVCFSLIYSLSSAMLCYFNQFLGFITFWHEIPCDYAIFSMHFDVVHIDFKCINF